MMHKVKGQGLMRAGGGASYQANALTIPNCILALPLNDVSGTTAVDLVLGTNSTYNGGFTLANLAGPGASMGKAVLLDGVSGYIQLPATALNSVFLPDHFTISIWTNLNEAWSTSNLRMGICIGADANNRTHNSFKTAASQIGFYDNRGGSANVVGPGAFSTSGWNNFILTSDKTANQLKAYVNGSQYSTTQAVNGTWAGALSSAFCFIGAYNGPSLFWKGWLMHCYIYSRALLASEIATLATAA